MTDKRRWLSWSGCRGWWWWRQQCSSSSRRSASIGGGPLSPSGRLTHSCRSFHDPPRPQRLQRFSFSTTTTKRQFHARSAALATQLSTTITTKPTILSPLFRIARPRFAVAAFSPSITPLRRLYSHSTMAQVKWPAAEVRQTFFKYFEEKGHTLGESHNFNLEAIADILTPPSQSPRARQSLTMTPPCSSPMRA